MKVIPKFQLGGGFESLFTIYKPVLTESPRRALASSGGSSSKEDSDEKGKLTEKDLFSMLKDLDGLPNEMKMLVNSLTTTLRMASATGNGDLNSLATTYLSSLYKLKQAKFNKELFKETYDRAVANGNLNDIAITLNGEVLALDKDQKIVHFSATDWVKVKDSEEYQPLTNSNLLWFRSHSPEYANSNLMLQIVENGIGLELVHKMIKDRFREIGTTSTSTDTFIPKEVTKGLQILEQMLQLGPEGYYKISTELSSSDQRLVAATLDYIYRTLPANAKTRLAIETPDGTLDSVKAVIQEMIFGSLDTTTKYSALYLGTEEKLSGKASAKDLELNTAMKWLAGYGAKNTFVINPGSSNSTMVSTNTMPLVDGSGNYLGVNTTLQLVAMGLYASILDWRSVSMGGRLIDPSALGLIVVTDGNISSIDFPCIEQNGVIIPDLSPNTRAKKLAAETTLKRMNVDMSNPESIKQNYLLINLVYEENGLPPAYDANGDIIPQKWRRFGVVNGKASNKALGMGQTEGNSLLQEDLDDNSLANYISIVKDENWDYNEWYDINGHDHLYKGTVWIPISGNYTTASASMKMKSTLAKALDELDLALDTRNLYVKPPQLP